MDTAHVQARKAALIAEVQAVALQQRPSPHIAPRVEYPGHKKREREYRKAILAGDVPIDRGALFPLKPENAPDDSFECRMMRLMAAQRDGSGHKLEPFGLRSDRMTESHGAVDLQEASRTAAMQQLMKQVELCARQNPSKHGSMLAEAAAALPNDLAGIWSQAAHAAQVEQAEEAAQAAQAAKDNETEERETAASLLSLSPSSGASCAPTLSPCTSSLLDTAFELPSCQVSPNLAQCISLLGSPDLVHLAIEGIVPPLMQTMSSRQGARNGAHAEEGSEGRSLLQFQPRPKQQRTKGLSSWESWPV